jgi:hypothetical protein
MAVEIDGFAVLGGIAAHQALFADITADVNKAARALLLKKLKSAKEGVKTLRDVRSALSDETFSLVVDGMSASEVKTIIGKLDKNHPEFKGSSPQWQRQQLCALADGSAEPVVKVKAPSTPRADKKTKSPTQGPERISSGAMAAVRKR